MYIGKFHKYKIAAICVAGIQDDHIAHVTDIVTARLNKIGYKILIFNSFVDFYNNTPYTKGAASIFHLPDFELVDLMIIFPETLKNKYVTENLISYAKAYKTPVICIDGEYSGCTNIKYTYTEGFEAVVRHVVEFHGKRDVYMMAGFKGNSFSEERISVFKKVLFENGITFTDDMLGYGDFWSDPTWNTMTKLDESGRKMPQAFICANDTMAITVGRFLEEKGFKIPDEVIVTGFDATYGNRIYASAEYSTATLDLAQMCDIIEITAQGYEEGVEIPCTKYVKYAPSFSQSCGCQKRTYEYNNDKLLKMNDFYTATQANETLIDQCNSTAIGCDNLNELAQQLSEFSNDPSWICINDDFLTENATIIPKSYHSVYTDEMICLSHKDGYNNEYLTTYKTVSILPALGKALKKYERIMLSPLHLQTEVMGYYAVVVDEFFPFENSFRDIRRFVSAVDFILENFRNRYMLTTAYKDLEKTHSIDQLTGLLNRHGFYAAFDKLLRTMDKNSKLLLLSADMDDLKKINEAHGHKAGDEAVIAVAEAVKSACNVKGVCARFGGDEFILVEPVSDEMNYATETASQLLSNLNSYNKTSGRPFEVSISVGTKAAKVTNVVQFYELLRQTDHLMYEQKRLKKATITDTPDEVGIKFAAESVSQFEQRIHEIFANENNFSYFYMDYDNIKWYVSKNECTPKCIISPTVGPLRALWQSGAIYPADRPIFNEIVMKLKRAINEKVTESSITLQFRITDEGSDKPVWYTMKLILEENKEGKLSELVGALKPCDRSELADITLRSFYTTTLNPIDLNRQISENLAKNDGKKRAFIHFDIRNFKLVNETYGETVGTELLSHIKHQLELYSTPEQVAARLNSDVFMILTPYETRDDIMQIIRDIQERMSDFNNIHYEFVFGVYEVTDPTIEPRLMGDRASIARNSIKKNAIESVAFYDEKMFRASQNRLFIESSMQSALENQEFGIYLQPKFSISKDTAVGYEALVRWFHPERGMIPPGDFIPLFEENGFVTKLDAYVWDCACQVLADWIERGYEPLPISVNVSRAHLKDDSFIRYLDNLTAKYNIPKKLLELEITESSESAESVKLTQEIKEHGYVLLMDDFGSGYSSLNTLKNTRFDVLKIDREFLSSFMSDEKGKKIISHTISMSQDVGLDLIAEGVETMDQAQFLSQCGCDVAQGYFYAKPMPVQDAESYLIKLPHKK